MHVKIRRSRRFFIIKDRSRGSGIVDGLLTYYFLRFKIIKLSVVDNVNLRLFPSSLDDLQIFMRTIQFVQS